MTDWLAHARAKNKESPKQSAAVAAVCETIPSNSATGSGFQFKCRAHSENRPVSLSESGNPNSPCPACGSGQYWQIPGDAWHCRKCVPMTSDGRRIVMTLTRPEHTPETRSVPADADLSGMLATACEGLSITPAKLRAELADNGDLPDLASGTLTPNGLRLVAESLVAVNMLPALAEEAKKRMSSGKGIDGSGGRGHHKNPTPNLVEGLTQTGEATVQAAAITGAGKTFVSDAKRVKAADPKTAEALALLADNPETKLAFVSDGQSEPEHVLLTLAIRDAATCKLRIASDQYDGLQILELLNHQTEGTP